MLLIVTGLYTPGKPSNLRILAATSHSVDLQWTAPESDGGTRISGYLVVCGTPVAHKTFYFSKSIKGSATNCTLTENLWPGRPYQFAVAARNTAGRGELSEFSASFTIPAEAHATGEGCLHPFCLLYVYFI